MRGDEPIRPIKLIVDSCTFSCRFLRIGVIRGTEENELVSTFHQGTTGRLTKILDGWVHLRHTHNVRDSAFCSNDTTERVGIFLTKLLKQHQSKLVEKLILATLLDDDGEAGSEIGGLLTNFCALVVKTPEDRGDDLCKVRLDANT